MGRHTLGESEQLILGSGVGGGGALTHSIKCRSNMNLRSQRYLSRFNHKCLILCSKILLNKLHSFVTISTYWAQTSPILKAFLATCSFMEFCDAIKKSRGKNLIMCRQNNSK